MLLIARRAGLVAILFGIALAPGCVGNSCRDVPVYPHADVFTSIQPSESELGEALLALGWQLPNGSIPLAAHELEDGRIARLVVPSPRGPGIMVSATGEPITKEDESRAILFGVVEPLATRFNGSTVYYGGGQHCGSV